MDTNNTSSYHRGNATQSVPPVHPGQTRLSQSAIQSWLRALNSNLAKAGRPLISDAQIENFKELLFQSGYSAPQAKLAQVFILCGKWTNYRSDAIQFEYFFPKEDDMRPFSAQFVPISVHDAQIREIQRQFDVEKQRINDEMTKKDKMYAEAVQEIRRLKREPTTPLPQSETGNEIMRLTKMAERENYARIEAEGKLRTTQKEYQLLLKRYNKLLHKKNNQ